jgi:hypothetical protein
VGQGSGVGPLLRALPAGVIAGAPNSFYLVGGSADGLPWPRTALLSVKTCRADDVRPGCVDALADPNCIPSPRALSTGCTRTAAPLDRVTVRLSTDGAVGFGAAGGGITLDGKTSVQSVALCAAVNGNGQLAVLYEAWLDSATIATRLAVLQANATVLTALTTLELQRYVPQMLPWRTGHGFAATSSAGDCIVATDERTFVVAYVVVSPTASSTGPLAAAGVDYAQRTAVQFVRIRSG